MSINGTDAGRSNAAQNAADAARCTNPAENRACTKAEVDALDALGAAVNAATDAAEAAAAAKAATDPCSAEAAAQQAQNAAERAQDAARAAASDPSAAAQNTAKNAADAAASAAASAAEAKNAARSLSNERGVGACVSQAPGPAPSLSLNTVAQLNAISVNPSTTAGLPSTYANVALNA
ncbi:hypothetical protein [Lysobacter capsici]|uniref:hypothetical protein n=1 Tax=Lysobacter capsici TaxID=435897 RepID=UPI001C0026FF|nr:hypothetical protein [Lysobacter capsici]QWF19053.1 hypothetical protein KME82_10105 [Lysobacter capsici]